ncbi:hypothetical protein GCM10023211_07530 [Orbus sasakiae]|uniref:Dialkylrecorsinol condensing enzyme n=1 Tax=Orbus sasakiae TaxID=1078475 RepID=A0ABP9N1L7_9GAMM
MKKNVLLVYYSQTGQLTKLAESFISPLHDLPEINLEIQAVEPTTNYVFPWSFNRFFNIFPETVHLRPDPIITPVFAQDKYDLIIIAYTVWFLSPSQPITALLQHNNTKKILAGTPVVTLIACRNMWLMAQETVKQLLTQSQAKLVDNVVRIDSCGGPASFIATPLWMLTGQKQPLRWLPKAGIDDKEINDCAKYGQKIKTTLLSNKPIEQPMFKHMSAVKVNERLILSEKIGYRSFYLWGKLLIKAGNISTYLRQFILYFYIAFLVCMICTVVPITALIKTLLSPWLKKRILKQKNRFSWPSGE